MANSVDLVKDRKNTPNSVDILFNSVYFFAQGFNTTNPANFKFTGFCIDLHCDFVEIRGIEPLTL